MIGNDVIDLRLSKTESNWQRKGWLNKLFSAKEIAHILESESPETLIWLYWSMKEAAYKIYNRMSGKANLAPSKFVCKINNRDKGEVKGHVHFNNHIYHTQSIVTDAYIHSIAKVNANQEISTLMNQAMNDFELPVGLSLHKDNNGLPYLQNSFTQQTIIASKSHHGSFQVLIY